MYLAKIVEENNKTTSFGEKGLFIYRHIYLGKQMLTNKLSKNSWLLRSVAK